VGFELQVPVVERSSSVRRAVPAIMGRAPTAGSGWSATATAALVAVAVRPGDVAVSRTAIRRSCSSAVGV